MSPWDILGRGILIVAAVKLIWDACGAGAAVVFAGAVLAALGLNGWLRVARTPSGALFGIFCTAAGAVVAIAGMVVRRGLV